MIRLSGRCDAGCIRVAETERCEQCPPAASPREGWDFNIAVDPGFRLSLCSCLCVWLGLSPAVFLLRLSGRDNNTCRGEKTRGSTVKNKQKTTHCACESATVAPLQPKQDIFKIQPELPAYRKEK